MSEHRFYLAPESWPDAPQGEALLEGQEAVHLAQSLRLGPGTDVTLLDGRGRTGRFSIVECGKRRVRLVCRSVDVSPEPVSRAIIALAFSKAVRRGFFMEKAVELGAWEVWLWQGDHSQGRLPADTRESWQNQMIAGAKQCGNPWLPQIRALSGGITDVLALSEQVDQRILPWELQDGSSMLTPDMAGRPGTTLYVIGPEGGFSARELEAMQAASFRMVSLGQRILRCETAATLCLGIHWWASHLTTNRPS
ncbi:16S rRNA (uracil(1498)-N(3))-methyltransferase [uncultured Desulfovibrio sp.]|uniref:16S rRNA (uracil(1498)-N(3))-methyltransferase n=1 Tax=uncultured Desulfovibrio sp. TaxID=167968 RepID=UPI003446E5EA